MIHQTRNKFLQNELPRLIEFVSIHPEFKLVGDGLAKQLKVKIKGRVRAIDVSSLYHSKDWEQDVLDYYNRTKSKARYSRKKIITQ